MIHDIPIQELTKFLVFNDQLAHQWSVSHSATELQDSEKTEDREGLDHDLKDEMTIFSLETVHIKKLA